MSHLKWSRICHTRQASCAASQLTPSPPCLRSPAHSDVTSLINDNLTLHSSLQSRLHSLDIFQVVIQYHVKLESVYWVCVLGYLWDLCARFIGKSFTGAGSGSGLSLARRAGTGAGSGQRRRHQRPRLRRHRRPGERQGRRPCPAWPGVTRPGQSSQIWDLPLSTSLCFLKYENSYPRC